MNIGAIIATFLSVAAFLKKKPRFKMRSSIGERHFRRRSLLRKKFGDGSAGVKVLDLTNEKPESVMRQVMLSKKRCRRGWRPTLK